MHTDLVPRPWFWLRLILVVPLLALAYPGTAPLTLKGLYCAMVLFIGGSYRRSRIVGADFERTMFLMFVPVRKRRWPIDRFTQIETDWKQETRVESSWFLGIPLWLTMHAFDRIIPWLGGPFKLWLRAVSGKRVLAWQGASEKNFNENIVRIQSTLGIPVQRK